MVQAVVACSVLRKPFKNGIHNTLYFFSSTHLKRIFLFPLSKEQLSPLFDVCFSGFEIIFEKGIHQNTLFARRN
jgi:hypothetical protein